MPTFLKKYYNTDVTFPSVVYSFKHQRKYLSFLRFQFFLCFLGFVISLRFLSQLQDTGVRLLSGCGVPVADGEESSTNHLVASLLSLGHLESFQIT